jgi:CubicO group peptidase (beta-lactamase class C family)
VSFGVFDLMAQRSGLPPYANEFLTVLGFDRSARIRSLRYVNPVSSCRSTFAYTNTTHILAGQIVARAEGAADWNAVLQSKILDPLGMKNTTYSAAAMTASANHAVGHRYTVDGSVEAALDPFPYEGDGAGDINSNVEDMAKWVSLQLANGALDGRQIVSPADLAYTHTPKIVISDKAFYALGWVVQQTPNGDIVFHSGITNGFAAIVALQLDRNLGVIVLSNQSGFGIDGGRARLMDPRPSPRQPDSRPWGDSPCWSQNEICRRVETVRKASRFATLTAACPTAGDFANPAFGKAALHIDGGTATLEFAATGAKLRLDPWNGAVYTATLAPDEKFAATVAKTDDARHRVRDFLEENMRR